MKRFFFFIFLILVLAGGAWFALEGLVYVPQGQILVAYDEKENRISGQYGSGFVPLYLKMIPGRISVHTINTDGQFSYALSLPLPQIEELSDQLYCVHCSIEVRYSLDHEKFVVTESLLKQKDELLSAQIGNRVNSAFSDVFSSFWSGSYDSELIRTEWPQLKENFFSDLTSRFSGSGIEIVSLEQTSPLVYPSNEIYASALQYLAALIELRKTHGLENESLKASLLGKNLELDSYYGKLERISKLLEKNPMLLQYMYIEKLGSNVSVIIPASSNGFPFGLDRTQLEKKDVNIEKNEDVATEQSTPPQK